MDSAMGMRYSPGLTALSMAIAMASSLFALWFVSADKRGLRRLIAGALIMGAGVALMHYTGMASMDVSPPIPWDYRWVTLSIIIAVLASFTALWLTFRLRHEAAQQRVACARRFSTTGRENREHHSDGKLGDQRSLSPAQRVACSGTIKRVDYGEFLRLTV